MKRGSPQKNATSTQGCFFWGSEPLASRVPSSKSGTLDGSTVPCDIPQFTEEKGTEASLDGASSSEAQWPSGAPFSSFLAKTPLESQPTKTGCLFFFPTEIH